MNRDIKLTSTYQKRPRKETPLSEKRPTTKTLVNERRLIRKDVAGEAGFWLRSSMAGTNRADEKRPVKETSKCPKISIKDTSETRIHEKRPIFMKRDPYS